MQSKSTFPARIAPFSVPEPLPFSRVGLTKARLRRFSDSNVKHFYNFIYGTVHEKIAPLIYYKNVIKMHHVCIAITSQRLTLSTSYFHHFILHHFSTVKCILESWTISVPTFLRAIPPGVQNYHIFV